jgi:hypothetical protein
MAARNVVSLKALTTGPPAQGYTARRMGEGTLRESLVQKLGVE